MLIGKTAIIFLLLIKQAKKTREREKKNRENKPCKLLIYVIA